MRVVAGRLRSRRLRTGKGGGIRPTTDRARAGLFDWLGPRIEGARVLDLFAGTGALGIEALSRGAADAVFVERARGPLEVLGRNLRDLDLSRVARVVRGDAARALDLLGDEGLAFDLVLADPPYSGDWLPRLARSERLVDLLAPGGLYVAERSRRVEPIEKAEPLELRGSRRYGEACFDWYERGDAAE